MAAATTGHEFFGRYEVLSELGRGGMGVVYKAYDPDMKRSVALKIIGTSLAGEKEIKRFEREASLMANLSHPNIVQIFDVGVANDRRFFTMELIEGTSLKELLAEKPSLHHLIAILIQASQAVHYAHQQGIIHRDLKPSNVMITTHDQAKVMDFGLAKKLEKSEKSLSQTGDTLGTPEYMSPEQADGRVRQIGPASDVYSLGIILYQMLAGVLPFTGTRNKILNQIVSQEPAPPSRHNPHLPPDLEAVCLKAIEKEQHRRYQSALEFAQDLSRYLEGKPVVAKPVTPLVRLHKWVRRHRLLTIASGSVAAVVLVMAVAFVVKIQQKNRELEAKIVKEKQLSKDLEEKRRDAEEKREVAANREALANLKATESKLSQVEAELRVCKLYMERQDYFTAYQRYQTAMTLLDDATKILQDTKPTGDQIGMAKSQLDRYKFLQGVAARFYKYGIAPHPHQSAPAQSFAEAMTQLATTPHVFLPYDRTYGNDGANIPYQPSWKWIGGRDFSKTKPTVADLEAEKSTSKLVATVKAGLKAGLDWRSTFSPDDRFMASGDQEGNVWVWNIAADQVVQDKLEEESQKTRHPPGEVRLLKFSPDSRWLCGITQEQTVIWEIPSLRRVLQIPYGTKSPACAFNSQSDQIALGGIYGLTWLYDLKPLAEKKAPVRQEIRYYAKRVCFGPGDKTLMMANVNDLMVWYLDKPTEGNLPIVGAYEGEILGIALSPDGKFLALVAQNARLLVWSTDNYQKLFEAPVQGFTGDVSTCSLVFHPHRPYLALWNADGINFYTWPWKNSHAVLNLQRVETIHKGDLELFQKLQTQLPSVLRNQARNNYVQLCFHPGQEVLAFFLWPGIYLWNLPSDQLHRVTGILEADELQLQFNSQGSLLLIAGRSITTIWELKSKMRVLSVASKSEYRQLSFQPFSDFLISNPSEQHAMKWWQIENGNLVLRQEIQDTVFEGEYSDYRNTFDDSGQFLATRGTSGIGIWRAEPLATKLISSGKIKAQISDLQTICFPSDALIALGNKAGELFFWDWKTKQQLHKLSLYSSIRNVWYDHARKMYWILTEKGLSCYPWSKDSSQIPQVDIFFPMAVYSHYPILAATFSPDFKYMALCLMSKEIVVLGLN